MLEDNKKILEKRESTFNLYRNEFDRYISDSKKEKNVVQEYQGRELLELIQNAEDECKDREGILMITLKENILTIENSGKPFDYKGVLSLMTANYSPKDSNSYIGNKGLGFRSVLSWSKNISIFSDKISVKFSCETADEFQKKLEADVKNFEDYQFDRFSLPIFSAPKVDIDYISPSKGMDTLIRLECKEEVLDRTNGILDQLRSINGKELLFLKNIGKIIVVINDEKRKIYEIVDDEINLLNEKGLMCKTSYVSLNNDDVCEYRIYQNEGNLKFLNIDNEEENKKYLISLAIPVNNAPIEKKLYSFFRTNIDSPFNFILNATLELTQNRNYLIPISTKENFNYKIIKKLSKFIVEAITHYVSLSKLVDYTLLKLLVNSDEKFLLSDSLNFYQEYISNLTLSKVLPTVNEEYISFDDEPAFYNNYIFSKYLVGENFQNLLKHTDDKQVIDFLRMLNVDHYPQCDLTIKINECIDDFNIKEKALLIITFVDYYKKYDEIGEDFPYLLVDNFDSIINDGTIKVFNKPSNDEVSRIPKIMKPYIRFVSKTLFDEIENIIKFKTANKIRETIERYLKYFNVSEYSFSALESTINGTKQTKIGIDGLKELIKWVYILYNSQNSDDLSNISITINLPCLDEEVLASDSIYFSDKYDNVFYYNLMKQASSNFKYLAEAKDIGLADENMDSVKAFFKWLGVNERPRIKRDTMYGSPKLKDYLSKTSIAYKSEILNDYRFNDNRFVYHTYDQFDEIVKNVKFHDLLIWLLDEYYSSENTPISSKNEMNGSYLIATWHRHVNNRINYYQLKSYTRYLLVSNKWVEVNGSDELFLTTQCTMDKIDVKPFLFTPKIDYKSIEKYNIDYNKSSVDKFLNDIGFVLKIKDLSYKRFYTLLSRLPVIDAEMKVTRKIYETLMEKIRYDNDEDQFRCLDEYRHFIKNGKILSKKGKDIVFNYVQKTYYSDKKDLCNGILDDLFIFDYPRRRGEETISKVFGTSVLKNTKVKIIESNEHKLDKDFQNKLNYIKPYIAVYRGASPDNNFYREVKNINIKLCSNIKIKYSLDESNEKEYDLKDYENIYSRENNVAYISVPSFVYDVNDLYSKYEFYESFSELVTVIIDVARDKEIYKNLIRDTKEISRKTIVDAYGSKGEDLLLSAQKELGLIVSEKDLFWRIISTLSNEDISCNNEEYSSLIYSDISCDENISHLRSLFKRIEVDFDDFNSRSNGAFIIDISEYVVRLIRTELNRIKKQYDFYIYSSLIKQNDISKSNAYLTKKRNYNFLYQNIEPRDLNTAYFNIDNIVSKLLDVDDISVIIDQKELNLETIINSNLNEYKKNYPNEHNKILSYYENEKVNAYALFNEMKLLYDSIEEVSNENTDDIKHNENSRLSVDEIKEIVKNSNVEGREVGISKQNKNGNSNNNGHGSGGGVHNPDKALDNGCIAEYFVYEKLKEVYNNSVKWVSGNANICINEEDVDDSLGYDIIYIDENNQERFVEVKSSQSKNISMKITRNEVEVGLKNKEKYDIHFVYLDENQTPADYKIIKNIFVFNDNENFLMNSKFIVFNDSYEIRAREN